MAGFNLPDGCMDVDIDREINCDDIDIRCDTCSQWEPFGNPHLPWGICCYKVNDLVPLTSENIIGEIAEGCITQYNDMCRNWILFS